jgi:hypothetical protein
MEIVTEAGTDTKQQKESYIGRKIDDKTTVELQR